MSKFLSVKEKWSLEEQFGQMLRELDEKKSPSKREEEFESRLHALMNEYGIAASTIVEWFMAERQS
ncbi:hypothetical protein [Halotalea alkalilenta]|uniref:hypothetical protein n=1 Tax=Halotalea alkalilenta TaxID=376489 RepID=UPI00123733CC|nr:hypothetical protein [Halotalea alkalilenta]